MAVIASKIADGDLRGQGSAAIGQGCFGECVCRDDGKLAAADVRHGGGDQRVEFIGERDFDFDHAICGGGLGNRYGCHRNHNHRGGSSPDSAP